MFRVKICGITTVEDALLAAEAGADAIGLNFYERSPRYVTTERAKEICEALCGPLAPRAESSPKSVDSQSSAHGASEPRGVIKVGVFVNSLAKGVLATSQRVGLDAIQLHGDEGPEMLSALRNLPIIRAFRCKEATLDGVQAFLRLCDQGGSVPSAVLLDAQAPGNYGGTGQVLDWEVIHKQRTKLAGLPLILAGGLTPENVAEAIRIAQPDAVDTASGVESAPGTKDPAKVCDFVAAAKKAFASLGERPA